MAETRVVLDTNVIVSGLLFRGAPAQVLDLAFEGAFRLVTSEPLLEELLRVLVKKFGFAKNQASETLAVLRELAEVVAAIEELHVITADEPDNRVLEAAVAGNAEFVVTGDTRHLLPIRRFRDVEILSPADFLNRRSW